jgi:prolyl-tRNA synthetase
VITDIANVREGDPCPNGDGTVILRSGIEIGNIFKLGTKYTKALGAEYLGEDGERHPIVMGSYGIGLGRNVACIVEDHHDDKGIVWPAEVAPYRAHLVALGANKDPRVTEIADRLHALAAEGGSWSEILYDDRDESPGVKFADADLLGMPWVLTVSPRSLGAGGIEVKNRATGEKTVRLIEDVEAFLAGRVATPA